QMIEESTALFEQYKAKINDPRSVPRRLAKSQVVNEVLLASQLRGIAEERWSYVALTWDAEDRAFFTDPFVAEFGGLPCFLSDSGADVLEDMRPRLGWIGYRRLENALGLRDDPDYVAAFATMQATVEPDAKDYDVAEANARGGASAESVALAAKLRHELFGAFEVAEYTGSYSVTRGSHTIAKIIPQAKTVFVGVRETESPGRWFSGPLEAVSVQGVRFVGVHVPADNPDASEAASLVGGLGRSA